MSDMSCRLLHRSRRGLVLVLILSMACIPACRTLTGDKDLRPYRFSDGTAYKFKVVSDEIPRPRIAWREVPMPAETLLTLAPDLPECQRVRFYAPDESNHVRRIQGRTFLTRVETAVGGGETSAQSEGPPDDPCGILITSQVRWDGVDRVCTLTFSTQDASFRSIDLKIPPSEQPARGIVGYGFEILFLTIFDIAGSIALSPFLAWVMIYEHFRPPGQPLDDGPVAVSFTFPDGSAREVQVTNSDFERLETRDPFEFGRPWNESVCGGVGCWSRAAMLKLGLDYREETATHVHGRGDDIYYKSPFFSMVGGHQGIWSYRLEGSRETYPDLDRQLGHGRKIYFSTESLDSARETKSPDAPGDP